MKKEILEITILHTHGCNLQGFFLCKIFSKYLEMGHSLGKANQQGSKRFLNHTSPELSVNKATLVSTRGRGQTRTLSEFFAKLSQAQAEDSIIPN